MADEKPGEKKPEQKVDDKKPDEKKPDEKVDDKKPEEKKPDEPAKKDELKKPEPFKLKLPEGVPFSDAELAEIETEANELGLTQEQGQKVADARAKRLAAHAATLRSELEADPELGGGKLAETEKLALAGRNALFPPGSEESTLIADFLDRTGLGNHKAVVRAFVRLGKMMAEDGHVIADAGGGKEKKTTAQKLYDGKG